MPLDSYQTVYPASSYTPAGAATYRTGAASSSPGPSWGSVGAGAASGAATGMVAGPYGALAGAAVGALGSYFSSKQQRRAVEESQQLQTTANRQATMFARQQAEQAWRDQERVNQANYGQNAARERRYGEVAQLLGLNVAPREIPAYVPGVDPHLDVEPIDPEPFNPKKGVQSTYKTLDQMLGGGPDATTTGGQMPSGIDPRLAAVYQRFGVTPGERGSGPRDWQYYQNEALQHAGGDWGWLVDRLASDLQGGSPRSTSAPSTASRDLLARSLSPGLPYQPLPTAPPLINPYRISPVASYFG